MPIPLPPQATLRQYEFMLTGLEEVEGRLLRLGISMDILVGYDPCRHIYIYI